MYDYIVTKPPLDEETLAHYGVKGMKWGVRKEYERVGRGIGSAAVKLRNRQESRGRWAKGDYKKLSTRLYGTKKQKLRNSSKWRTEKDATKAGKRIVKNALIGGAAVAGLTAAKYGAAAALTNKGFKIFKDLDPTGMIVGDLAKGTNKAIAQSAAKDILKNTAITTLGIGAFQTYRYAKYETVRTHRSASNRGK